MNRVDLLQFIACLAVNSPNGTIGRSEHVTVLLFKGQTGQVAIRQYCLPAKYGGCFPPVPLVIKAEQSLLVGGYENTVVNSPRPPHYAPLHGPLMIIFEAGQLKSHNDVMICFPSYGKQRVTQGSNRTCDRLCQRSLLKSCQVSSR